MPQHLYKLVQNNNEHMQEAYQKWYARPVYTGTLDLNGIAELISRPSCRSAHLSRRGELYLRERKREHPNAGCSLCYGLMWMAYASSSAAQSILV